MHQIKQAARRVLPNFGLLLTTSEVHMGYDSFIQERTHSYGTCVRLAAGSTGSSIHSEPRCPFYYTFGGPQPKRGRLTYSWAEREPRYKASPTVDLVTVYFISHTINLESYQKSETEQLALPNLASVYPHLRYT